MHETVLQNLTNSVDVIQQSVSLNYFDDFVHHNKFQRLAHPGVKNSGFRVSLEVVCIEKSASLGLFRVANDVGRLFPMRKTLENLLKNKFSIEL